MGYIGSYKNNGKFTGERIMDRYNKDQIVKLHGHTDESSICRQLNITKETYRKYLYFLQQEGRL